MKTKRRITKRPVCPKCGAAVDCLLFTEQRRVLRQFTRDGVHEEDSAADETVERTYECPECCEQLFDDEDDACIFLQGQAAAGMATASNSMAKTHACDRPEAT